MKGTYRNENMPPHQIDNQHHFISWIYTKLQDTMLYLQHYKQVYIKDSLQGSIRIHG